VTYGEGTVYADDDEVRPLNSRTGWLANLAVAGNPYGCALVVAGARFLGETAGLVPGAPGDLVAYPADPFSCPDEQLLELSPAATVVGGELTYSGR
jgi:hypothetical protein